MALASSLSTAFLLLLERLTPKERAAYLPHEIFEVPYSEIASTLDIRKSACRKLVSRARGHIDQEGPARHPAQAPRRTARCFEMAVADGRTDSLAALLSDDIERSADSGGKVAAVGHVLRGKADVLAFIARACEWWASHKRHALDINGTPGRRAGNGRPDHRVLDLRL